MASTRSPTAPATPPTTIHGTRRPNRDIVRSDSAPHSGFATRESAAPTAETRPSAASFASGASAAAWLGSRIWMGPKSPIMMHSQARLNRSAHERVTGRSGSPVASGGVVVTAWTRMRRWYQV